jgi:outer membrane protein assembly factor BamB
MPSQPVPARQRSVVLAAGVLIACLGFVVAPAAGEDVTATDSTHSVSDSLVENGTPDPATDRLGWENGVWANATLSVDQSDGITEAELTAVVSRTMARVESVRGIEFERTPPTRILYVEEHVDRLDEALGDAIQRSGAESTALNQQYEALFLLNEATDAVEARRALAASAGGYYDPQTGNVTVLSSSNTVRTVREPVLAQELFHAQQDNQFDLPSVGGLSLAGSIEARNTNNSYIEGDANYVEALYRQRCDDEWSGTCYRPGPGPRPDTGSFDRGVARLFRQPYESGVAFVRGRHESSGWEAVDELYESPPASTEQVIHPDAYGEDQPTELSIDDRSTRLFRPLRVDGERVVQSVGEAGLYTALVTPAMETVGQTEIIPRANHQSDEPGPPAVRFDHPATAGWDGDRLLPYVATDSNATGYVYETAWDTPADARAFHDAYRRLLAYHGATPVPDRPNTYRIPDSSGFTDAFYLDRTGDRLRVVNAPSVDTLDDIQRGAGTVAPARTAPSWERSTLAWEFGLDRSTPPSPTVSNGTLYVQSRTTLTAVDGATGQQAWERQFDNRLVASTVSNGTVYAVTSGPAVVALDATTGDTRWNTTSTAPATTLVVAGDTVYARTLTGSVETFDAATGTAGSSIDLGRRSTVPVVTNGTVVAGTGSELVAVDAATGERTWRTPLGGNTLPPTLSAGTVYVPVFDTSTRAVTLRAVNATTGNVTWTHEGASLARLSVTPVNGTVYVKSVDTRSGGTPGSGSPTGVLTALAASDGSVQWRTRLNGSVEAAPVVAGQTVYVGSSTGTLHAIATDSGQRRWTVTTTGAIDSRPVVTDHTLYAGTQDGVLSAFDVTTGDEQWSFVAAGLPDLTATAAAGAVYASGETSLYGIEGSAPAPDDPDSGGSSPTDDPDSGENESTNSSDSGSNGSSTDGTGPGFGVLTGVVALAAAGVFVAVAALVWGRDD